MLNILQIHLHICVLKGMLSFFPLGMIVFIVQSNALMPCLKKKKISHNWTALIQYGNRTRIHV